jgi:hypothetical protein
VAVTGQGVRVTEPLSLAKSILTHQTVKMAENIDYKGVLEDLRARRDAMNVAIQAIEAISGDTATPTIQMPSTGARTQNRAAEIEHDTFVGMNVADATARYLGMVGRPARGLDEITTALNRGGLNSTTATVQTLLSRSHNGPNPVVRRAGRGTWGLPEWYQSARS